jgi:hypothetical protein
MSIEKAHTFTFLSFFTNVTTTYYFLCDVRTSPVVNISSFKYYLVILVKFLAYVT